MSRSRRPHRSTVVLLVAVLLLGIGTYVAYFSPLLVVREAGGYSGDNDRVIDLRVDDHPDPIKELIRIRVLHTLYFGETGPEDVVAVDGDVREQVVSSLRRLGYLREDDPDDEALYKALTVFIGTENFEEREQARGYLDRAVLEFIRGKG